MIRGFTLLELLVALAIFALLSALGFAGLQSLLQTRHLNAEHDRAFAQLTRAMVLLQQDIEQAIARPVRDSQGDPTEALRGNSSGTPSLELTRSGWLNLGRSDTPGLQRIGYHLDGERLLRRAWPVLDRAPDSAPRQTVILAPVTQMQLRYLDADRNWRPTWPPADTARAMPLAIELRIESPRWGSLRRLFRVPHT